MSTATGPSTGDYDKRLALIVVSLCAMAGNLMQAIDMTIVNVSLPYMQGSLQASRDQITWVLTSYIVMSAIMTAPVGWISARFGRKNFLIFSLAGFTLASALCGMAMNLDQIVIFRILQGVFGAALAPLSQAIMLDLYPAEKRGEAMAIWGMAIMVGPIMGPTLGGYLTDYYSWRWIFYVNLPLGIASLVGIWIFFRDNGRDEALRFDWTGFVVLSLGLGAFQLMLDRGATKDWFSSTEIIAEAVIAGIGLYLFLVHMFMTDKPFIRKEMFTDRNFVSATILMFLISMVLLSSTALLPPYLENLGGYTVLDAGLLLAPRGVGAMISMYIAGRISNRFDPRLLIGAGTALVLWSIWKMAHWTPAVSEWDVGSVTFLQGAGLGLVTIPTTLMAFVTLPGPLRTDGSAIFNLIRKVGAAIGISVTTTVLADALQTAHANLASHATDFNRNLGLNAPSMFWNPHLPFGLESLNGLIERNASVIAYADDFLFMFYICLPVLLMLVFMRPPDSLAAEDPMSIEVE